MDAASASNRTRIGSWSPPIVAFCSKRDFKPRKFDNLWFHFIYFCSIGVYMIIRYQRMLSSV